MDYFYLNSVLYFFTHIVAFFALCLLMGKKLHIYYIICLRNSPVELYAWKRPSGSKIPRIKSKCLRVENKNSNFVCETRSKIASLHDRI
jgi:hypothetical protein